MNGTNFNDDERGLLPFPVILAATKGDPDAMKVVLQHYQSYIAHLSMTKIRDERGSLTESDNAAYPTPHVLHQLSKRGNEPESITVHHGTFQHQYDAELLRTRHAGQRNGRNGTVDCLVVKAEFTTLPTTFEQENVRGFKEI